MKDDAIYYLDEQGNPLCIDCAEECVGGTFDEVTNDTGKPIQCDGCGEDIPSR